MQKPRITAAILVENNGKYLMAKRNKKNAYGKWIIPGGGVEWGETIKEAAQRELKEETNLDVENLKFICHKEVIRTDVDYHRVIFFYLAKPKHHNIKVSDDVSEAKYFTIEEIKKLDIIHSVPRVFKELGIWD